MKKRKFPWFWLVFALLIVAYPLYWWISAATTVPNPDATVQLDPYGLSLFLGIIIAPVYVGALLFLVLLYETLLFALKKTSKKRFITVASILGTLVLAAAIYFIFLV